MAILGSVLVLGDDQIVRFLELPHGRTSPRANDRACDLEHCRRVSPGHRVAEPQGLVTFLLQQRTRPDNDRGAFVFS